MQTQPWPVSPHQAPLSWVVRRISTFVPGARRPTRLLPMPAAERTLRLVLLITVPVPVRLSSALPPSEAVPLSRVT